MRETHYHTSCKDKNCITLIVDLAIGRISHGVRKTVQFLVTTFANGRQRTKVFQFHHLRSSLQRLAIPDYILVRKNIVIRMSSSPMGRISTKARLLLAKYCLNAAVKVRSSTWTRYLTMTPRYGCFSFFQVYLNRSYCPSWPDWIFIVQEHFGLLEDIFFNSKSCWTEGNFLELTGWMASYCRTLSQKNFWGTIFSLSNSNNKNFCKMENYIFWEE